MLGLTQIIDNRKNVMFTALYTVGNGPNREGVIIRK